jgi:hypothetical protein
MLCSSIDLARVYQPVCNLNATSSEALAGAELDISVVQCANRCGSDGNCAFQIWQNPRIRRPTPGHDASVKLNVGERIEWTPSRVSLEQQDGAT